MEERHENDIDSSGSDSDDQSPSQRYSCNVCTLILADLEAQREHFKAPIHRYNIRRVMQLGLPPVLEAHIEGISEAVIAELEGMRFLNGHESDSSTEGGYTDAEFVSHSELRFVTKEYESMVFVIYRHILGKNIISGDALFFRIQSLQARPLSAAIIMLSGGHFAAALFNGLSCTLHKSIHRYTTRRKQGGAQSANDKSKGHAKSAGANLRRYNEAALTISIRGLLLEWKTQLNACEKVFIHAPGSNKRILFGYEQRVLNPSDERLDRLPFTTRRPTLSECIRCMQRLAVIRTEHRLPQEQIDKTLSLPTAEVKVAPSSISQNMQEILSTNEATSTLSLSSASGLQKKKKRHKVKLRNPLLISQSEDLSSDSSNDDPVHVINSDIKPQIGVSAAIFASRNDLSPEFRIALDRERRARAAEKRMGVASTLDTRVDEQVPVAEVSKLVDIIAGSPISQTEDGCCTCGTELTKVPLIRLGKRYCSVKCVAKTKRP